MLNTESENVRQPLSAHRFLFGLQGGRQVDVDVGWNEAYAAAGPKLQTGNTVTDTNLCLVRNAETE